MKKTIYILFLFWYFTIPSSKIIAQIYSDAGMWNTFSLEKELSNKFSISADEEFRLKENFTMLNLFYTNLGLNYKPIKGVKLALTYRLIEKWKYEYQYFSFRNRLMFDLSYKYKFYGWSISYRSRIQSEVRDINTSDIGKIPEWYWRNKIDIKRQIRQYIPYIGTEFRYQLSDPRSPTTNFAWHRVRMYAGIDYEINKRNTFGLYYLIQREFDVVEPEYLYIVGLQYSITLPSKN